jgi:hypothetical protein
MAVWDELKVVLARLRDEQPGALMMYPMPEVDEGRHRQPHAPAWLRHPARRLGNLRHARPRPAHPRLAPRAHSDPAPHHHRLNHHHADDRRNCSLKLDTILPGRPRYRASCSSETVPLATFTRTGTERNPTVWLRAVQRGSAVRVDQQRKAMARRWSWRPAVRTTDRTRCPAPAASRRVRTRLKALVHVPEDAELLPPRRR